MKKALLIVSFGSTVPAARQCLEQLAQALRQVAGRDCFHVYSSGFIRRKLGNPESPQQAIDRLLAEGYGDIFVQPTFLIPGVEYDKLAALTARYPAVRLGSPLILDAQQLQEAAKALADTFPAGEALLLMGHGTEHLANFIFPALQTALNTLGRRRCYVATVEGWPTLEDAMAQMRQDGVTHVTVAPFLLVAGDHVVNDMMGEGGWADQLSAAGFVADCRPVGLAELPRFQALFQAHYLRANP